LTVVDTSTTTPTSTLVTNYFAFRKISVHFEETASIALLGSFSMTPLVDRNRIRAWTYSKASIFIVLGEASSW